MFEFLGYFLVVALLGFGLFTLSGEIEEAGVNNSGDKAAVMSVVFILGVVLIFLSGVHLGGSGEREKERREEIVKVEKELWTKDVKGKFEAYSVALNKLKKDLSVATNELSRVVIQYEKTKGYMESNMVPRYVVAPIAGEVGEFRYSNVFPKESVLALIDFLDSKKIEPVVEPKSVPKNVTNVTNTTTNALVKVKGS